MSTPIKIILGAASIGDSSATKIAKFDTPEEVNAYLDTFYERGYRQIDTARGYPPGAAGTSEERLGTVEAYKRFTIDSKVRNGEDHPHSKENILENARTSLDCLKAPDLNVYYLHTPDRTTGFEEACEAMNEAYKAGQIKKFGISNHSPEEVEQFVKISEEKGYLKPTVYQGQYNPIVRGGEKELFPILRKHNIAFYAYSPAGGGFFAGNHKGESTRFDTSTLVGKFYFQYYGKPELEAAYERAIAAGAKHDISGHAAALRWTVYHSILDYSLGDAVIIGASSLDQLKQNLDIIESGPLPKEVADAVEDIYHQQVGEGEIPAWF